MRHIIKSGTGIVLALLLAGCKGETGDGSFLLDAQRGEPAISGETGGEPDEEPRSAAQRERLFIYVCGQVRRPGVYELPEGSRICDALEAAGGLTDLASPDYWNLARLLEDGEMLFFPTEEEAEKRRDPSGAAEETDVRVNINTADADRLATLPGIGKVRAAAILAYRGRNGAFSCREELLQVSGIGNALFESIKDFITVD